MRRFGLAVMVWTWGVAAAASPQAAGVLRLHPQNPHYFEYQGKPTVLVTSGEHYGAVLNLDFNYIPYLDELQSKGLNNTRLWTGTYVEIPGAFGIQKNTLAPASGRYICPWARSSTPGYPGGGNKFNLNVFDAAYFARLRDFVGQASARGIVVEVNLFCTIYDDSLWAYNPMNAANNVNGIGTVGRNAALTLGNGNLLAVQDAVTRKIVTELNGFDNVYYEVCNEPYAGSVAYDWQLHIAQVVWDLESTLAQRHLISLNAQNGTGGTVRPPSTISILNWHYADPPDVVANYYGWNVVIGENETGFDGPSDYEYRKEGWHFILAGGGLYNNLDYSFTVARPDGTDSNNAPGGGSPALRSQLKILKDFIHGFNFVAMSPANGILRGGVPAGATARALAEAGQAYAIYISGGSQANLVVSLPSSDYRAEWVNTRTGAVDRAENFSHPGGDRTISSPGYSEDIALRILRTGAPPPPPPPPPPGSGTFYRAINLNGPATTIDGNPWQGSNAPDYSYTGSAFENQSVFLDPPTDAARAAMIRSSIWNRDGSNVRLTNVPAGSYQVFLYVWEDNFSQTYDVTLEGQTVRSGYSSGSGGHWDRLGPWNVSVSDGSIDLACSPGDANLSGIEVWRLDGTPPPPPPPSGGATFYRAINLNGPATTIDGNPWQGSNAPDYSYTGSAFENQAVTLSPATDAARAAMIRSSIWNRNGSNVRLINVPSSTYRVYLYVWEDNFSQTYDVRLEGQTVLSGYSSGAGGHWDKLGPWTVAVSDGSIDLQCSAGDANLSGIEVWRIDGTSPPPADSGLVLHWRLDETSGSTAADSSGNGNTGTLQSGPVWTTGRVGGGLDLNGAGEVVTAPASASLNSLSSEMTVALWVYKRADAPTYGGLAGRRYGSQWEDLWVLFYNNSGSDEYSFGLTTSAGAAYLTGPSSAGDRNSWVHLAAVYDGSSIVLYRNGAEAARRSHSGTLPGEDSPLIVGGGDNGSEGFGEYVNAVLDDVRVYHRALSAAEVQGLAASTSSMALMAESLSAPGASPSGSRSGQGGCGLMGVEILLVLAAVRIRRRATS